MKIIDGFNTDGHETEAEIRVADPALVEQGLQITSITRMHGARSTPAEDLLAVEEPLEIQLEYGPLEQRLLKPISVTMRTPGHDEDLAAGFLFTEGVIGDPEDIEVTARVGQNMLRIKLRPDTAVKTASLERNFYITSSCGVCGKASLLALQAVSPPRRANRFRIKREVLCGLPEQLRREQLLFQRTGGLHAAGLFDSAGCIHLLREDVGRHNAVDKLIGSEWLADRVPLQNQGLLLSGRASFELLQKAVMAGIPMVACVGAPSSLAVTIAHQFDITLTGFLHKDSFNIYHGAARID